MLGAGNSLAIICLALAIVGTNCATETSRIYKMCVPSKFYEDCLKLLKDPSEAGIQMECVAGRDRIDCLDLINKRKADILAVEPEDMYIAYHMKNQDFRVISEFRTKVEENAEFRYEGVILVKKNSDIKSLNDLQGKKSCHTGFGRNVGYKIPITKLKNGGVLKVSLEPEITATERELKALSEFFSKSCLVGTYSPHEDVDRQLKKKYSNLCALCENPKQCNYPDKYSGYDGAIRCLDQGEGEVAFTKTSFIKKYFGLVAGSTAEGSPDNFEYLCEDGSRRSITGPACSWAQRPWKGYISNTDTVREDNLLKNLQQRLDKFFENALKSQNKKSASNLLIEDNLVLHEKPKSVEPKEYLERAGYKDVIERDGSATFKIKLCVQYDIELKKCDALRRAAFSRDVRPDFECILDTDCIKAVQEKKATALVVQADHYKQARDAQLEPIVYESFGEDNVLVVVVDPSLSNDLVKKSPIQIDMSNPERAKYAARLLNTARGKNVCDNLPEVRTDQMLLVNSKDLGKYKNKQILCQSLERKPVTEYRTCNFEARLPTAIFARKDMTEIEKESMRHAFISLSDKFGPKGKLEDVFELYGRFKDGNLNVLFDEDTVEFTTDITNKNVNEHLFNELTCH